MDDSTTTGLGLGLIVSLIRFIGNLIQVETITKYRYQKFNTNYNILMVEFFIIEVRLVSNITKFYLFLFPLIYSIKIITLTPIPRTVRYIFPRYYTFNIIHMLTKHYITEWGLVQRFISLFNESP